MKQRLSDFRDVCNDKKCRLAADILLSGLNGGGNVFSCDIINILYKGVPGQQLDYVHQFEKGYRDMVTPYNGYLLSYTGAALLALSAFESTQSLDINEWKLL